LATSTIELYDDLLQGIKTAQAIDALAAEVHNRIVGTQIVNIPDLQRVYESENEPSNKWKVTAGYLTSGGRIYVPKDYLLRNKVICLFHDNSESRHFGALKTGEWVSRDFHWPPIEATVRKYIA